MHNFLTTARALAAANGGWRDFWLGMAALVIVVLDVVAVVAGVGR